MVKGLGNRYGGQTWKSFFDFVPFKNILVTVLLEYLTQVGFSVAAVNAIYFKL